MHVFVTQGLIPRAKLLLTIGGTFFLGFWPLILITIGFILCLYIVRSGSLPVLPFHFVLQLRKIMLFMHAIRE